MALGSETENSILKNNLAAQIANTQGQMMMMGQGIDRMNLPSNSPQADISTFGVNILEAI